MSKLYAEIEPKIKGACEQFLASKSGPVTLAGIWDMVTSFIARVIVLVEETAGYTGAEKKEAVIQAVETYYNEVIAPLDIPGIPNFIEPVFDAALGRAVRPAVEGMIDALVRLFDTMGWPGKGETDFPLPGTH